MAEPVENNYQDDDQYEDDEFEEYLSDEGDDEANVQYESADEDNSSVCTENQSTILEKYKPVYKAPLVISSQSTNYASSSEDENEAVVGQTIAEINTIPMNFTDAGGDYDAKSILTCTDTETETYTDRTKLPDSNSNSNLDMDQLVTERSKFSIFKRKAGWYDNGSMCDSVDATIVAQTDSLHAPTDSETDHIEDAKLEAERRKLLAAFENEASHKDEDEEDLSDDDVAYHVQSQHLRNEHDDDDDEREYENQEDDNDVPPSQEANDWSNFREEIAEYRKLNFVDQDSQSEVTNTSLLESRRSRSVAGEQMANEEDTKSDVNQYDEDDYEEDFEDEDQDEDEDDEEDNKAEQQRLRAIGGSEIKPSKLKDDLIAKIEALQSNGQSLTNITNTSQMTSMLARALDATETTSVESIESMIKVLNLIKGNLNACVESPGATTTSSTSLSDCQATTTKAFSDSKLSSLTKKAHEFVNAHGSRSLSKIPCLIDGYRKPSYIPETPAKTATAKETTAYEKISHLTGRDMVSDYDSCSTSSSKSMKNQFNDSQMDNRSNSERLLTKESSKKIAAVSDYDSCSTSSSRANCHIQSRTPSSCNSRGRVTQMNQHTSLIQNKTRVSNRKNFSFSNERLREIERHNIILLRKIESQKPSYVAPRQAAHLPSPASAARISSAAVNRKKQQRQIDLDNLCLKRKLEAIHFRRNRK